MNNEEKKLIFEILSQNFEANKEIIRLVEKTTIPPKLFERVHKIMLSNAEQLQILKTQLSTE